MYNDYTTSTADTAALAGLGGGMLLFLLIICVFLIAVMWKIYTKAGREGWKSIIPFYNMYVLFEIAGLNGWLFLLTLIPYVNFVVIIYVYYKLAQAFGKGIGFTIGIIFLSPIFLAILAFGSAEYQLASSSAPVYNTNPGVDPNAMQNPGVDPNAMQNPGVDPNAMQNQTNEMPPSDQNSGM